MSDPNQFQPPPVAAADNPNQFQAPPPPPPPTDGGLQPAAPRPVHLRPVAIGLVVVGLITLVTGIAKILTGGILTGVAFLFWGILLFAFSFIRLPQTSGADEAPMSGIEKLAGIFYEPTRVFRNLRAHPRWLAALLVLGVFSGVYSTVFVQRLTAERIIDYKYEKMEQSPIKPPPEQMASSKEAELQAAKQPIQQIQAFALIFLGVFVMASSLAALYLVGVLVFGGRINFWQAFAATLYSFVPIAIIGKGLSLVILFIKAPEDIHPILGAETLLQDNLGVLFLPAEHPVFFVLAGSIGVLSLYGLWLRVKGLQHAGTKVSSSAAWGVTLTFWLIGTFLLAVFTFFFSSFIS